MKKIVALVIDTDLTDEQLEDSVANVMLWDKGTDLSRPGVEHEGVSCEASRLRVLGELKTYEPPPIGPYPFVRIRQGWHQAGREGMRIGSDRQRGGQAWTPIAWDDDEDPDWHKAAGLEESRPAVDVKPEARA